MGLTLHSVSEGMNSHTICFSSIDIVRNKPCKSANLHPFSTSMSYILLANCNDVNSTPLIHLRGFAHERNLDYPFTLILAPFVNKYCTTLDMPRADAIINEYNSFPVVSV